MMYKIKFPPMAIDGFLSMTLQMIDGIKYSFDKSGSIVEFTPDQLKEAFWQLRDMRNFALRRNKEIEALPEKSQEHLNELEMNNDSIKELDQALEVMRASVMGAKNIAQASVKPETIAKYCEKFQNLALSKLKAVQKSKAIR